MKKIRVGILCGGKSGEHEVSLQSAKNIIDAIDKSKYEIFVIGIDKMGKRIVYQPTAYGLTSLNYHPLRSRHRGH